ncbi:peptidase S41 family protein [Setomelanomma holmii]|uniref:Peptidase S41 family protein n=1 Tax=Setomelanomma holmii TaxID=210430 RepID=A0A9P4HL43_9PLEO|nr:peptidase S41 family protein [Setomelanomma holmii]
MLFARGLLVACFAACGFARSLPNKVRPRQASSTTDAPDAQATICGDIVDSVNEGYQLFWASDAYACLTSVPFNDAVATRFIKYWNDTIQFQSTIAYLKNPPEGYQQPAVDVVAELNRIQQRVNEGSYANQYDFEADFQLLTYALHDSHVYLTAGVLSAFSFAAPYEIASVSSDGKQAPKVYITDDLLNSAKEGWTPSAITNINGTEVNQFLTQFAALNAWGYVEPHAEWNALMSSPTLDIQGGLTVFSGAATFYPGDNLTYTFENGTSLDTYWLAIYNEVANYTGPLTTGGDFYNYFVLGLLPASFDPTLIVSPTYSGDNVSEPANWYNASFGAFPEDPAIAQADLGILGGGFVTGYVLEDISTGVLSLPSFDAIPQTLSNYSLAVNQAIAGAAAANLTRIVIDLQRNPGGATLLPYTIFKAFFPDLSPFAGSRRRSFPLANVIGSATTKYWDALDENNEDDYNFKAQLAADEWVITNRINAATGKNFTSWQEYQGPVNANGDAFSLTERYDLANVVFDIAAFDEYYPVMYLPNKTAWPFQERIFNPDQIVLLTDGLCASACSLFVEMMTRAGVKTIVAGGHPKTGPMQTASGTRGAIVYSAFDLDDDMTFASSIDNTAEATLPQIRDTGVYTKAAGFNVRDQIRKDETTPLQFKYEAADCRIYYTIANIYNMTQLWHDAATAAFIDPSNCVDGSRGFSTTNNTSPNTPPKRQSQKPILSLDTNSVKQVRFDDDPNDGYRSALGKPVGGNDISICPSNGIHIDHLLW